MKHINQYAKWGILSLLLVFGISTCSVHGDHHRKADHEKILKRTSKKLDLTGAQQLELEQVLSTADTFKEKMQARHATLGSDLAETFSQAELDVDVLNARFDELETEFSSFRRQMIQEYAEFHASLDEAQQQKLLKEIQNMEKYMRH